MEHSSQLPAAEPETDTRVEYGFPLSPNTYEVKTWARQEAYLAAYATCGRVFQAAEIAEVTPRSVSYWVSADSFSFEKRYTAARLQYLELMEAEADRRAIEGIDHPVVHKGKITATYKQYSDNLLMFRMKKLDPAYRDSFNLTVDVPDEFAIWMRTKQTKDLEARKALPEPEILEHEPKDEPAPWVDE